MNINVLSNLLAELSSRNISKVSPAAKTDAAAGMREAATQGKKVLEALSTGAAAEKQAARAETKQTAEPALQQPVFTPLPLRSELYPEARFFARLEDREEASAAGGEPVAEVFIHVVTGHLGHIWINLVKRQNYLSVKYFTDNEAASRILRDNFPPVREDLKAIGFQEVSLTSQARTALGRLTEELLPKFEAYLLNRRI